MPTTLERTYLTHKPQIDRGIALAADKWPDATTSRELLERIISDWATNIEDNDPLAAKRAKIRAASGTFNGVFHENYLGELRDGWKE
jgi:hypothetical protein